jgi:LEA14-like dessication related protein
MSWKIGLVGALGALLAGCPSAQVKPTGDQDVAVKLRRVEVLSASYDQMELQVVVSVENNTATEYAIEGASAKLEVLGKGKDRQGDPAMITSRDEVKAAALKTGAGTAEAAEEGDEASGDDEEAPVEEAPAPEEPAEDLEDEGGMLDDSADNSGVEGITTSGTGPSSGKVPAFERTDVSIPMTLKLPAGDAFGRMVNWRRIVVKATGELKYGGKTVPLRAFRELAAPNLPIVVLKSAQVASEDNGLVGAAFFDIGLENPNPFVIKVDDFSYAIEVAGKTLREMEGDRESVPPSSLQGFEENFQMTDEIYGKDLRTIMRQNTVPYRIWGKTTVRGIESSFEFSGEMQFPR